MPQIPSRQKQRANVSKGPYLPNMDNQRQTRNEMNVMGFLKHGRLYKVMYLWSLVSSQQSGLTMHLYLKVLSTNKIGAARVLKLIQMPKGPRIWW